MKENTDERKCKNCLRFDECNEELEGQLSNEENDVGFECPAYLDSKEMVLISLNPRWCIPVFNREKQIEVRKTKPKLEPPFAVPVYATKPKRKFDVGLCFDGESNKLGWICKCNYEIPAANNFPILSGKVIGEFICEDIIEIPYSYAYTAYDKEYGYIDISKMSCLSQEELFEYGKGETLYGWRISKPFLFNKPKELSDFMTLGALSYDQLQEDVCNYCRPTQRGEIKMVHAPNGVHMCEGRFCDEAYKTYLEEEFSLKKPPQSWCYVKKLE